MSVSRLISPFVPVLRPNDTGDRALQLMEENHLSQLPLVSDDNYLALVTEKEINDWDEPEMELSTAGFLQFRPAVLAETHPYDALKIMRQHQLAVLPIVDMDHKFLGAVTQETMLSFMIDSSSLDNPGGIIVLEIEPRNYSLYQIARICENEDVMVLHTQMRTMPTGIMEVTLKTNRTSLQPLVSSFERHEYKVAEVYGDPEDREDLMDKYRLLMNYLNM
ncbi:MAG: CBS domain-containing protein [Chitinophagia bacterium]|nr:CBS domain-containing protein [Chitinophagia bacterium]